MKVYNSGNIREQRAAMLTDAQTIVEGAKSAQRGLTGPEQREVDEILQAVDKLDLHLAKADEDMDRMRRLSALGSGLEDPATAGNRFLKFDAKALTAGLLDAPTVPGRPLVKSLIAAGASVAQVSFVTDPIAAGRPATGLWDVIPARKVTRDYSYLVQTTRTNLAAPVAPGDLKPTSVYTLTRKDGRLRVVAHLSEPVDVYALEDAPSLEQFVRAEMTYGLETAIAAQALTGDGLGENFTGLASTVGIQTQAFATSAILTLRAALTKIELQGYGVAAIVLHPTDWATIETTTATTGEFIFGSAGGAPIDRAARRLWGAPVVVTPTATAGTAWVIGEEAAVIMTDGRIRGEWGTVADDFARNQLRARLEGRFNLAVLRPLGIVKATIAAA